MPGEAAARYAAVLDAADALLKRGEASVEAEAYQAGGPGPLAPLYPAAGGAHSAISGGACRLPRSSPALTASGATGRAGTADFPGREMPSRDPISGLLLRDGPYRPAAGPQRAGLLSRPGGGYLRLRDFSGALTYYVSGLAKDHFWCNTQRQRFQRVA